MTILEHNYYKEWAALNESGVCLSRTYNITYLSMGVVKLDDVVNWDTEQMAREKP